MCKGTNASEKGGEKEITGCFFSILFIHLQLSKYFWLLSSTSNRLQICAALSNLGVGVSNCRSGWNRQAVQTFPPSSTTRLHDRVLRAVRRAQYSRNMLISTAAASWRPRADCASPCAPSQHPEAGTSPRTERSSSHFTMTHRILLYFHQAACQKTFYIIMQIFHHSVFVERIYSRSSFSPDSRCKKYLIMERSDVWAVQQTKFTFATYHK